MPDTIAIPLGQPKKRRIGELNAESECIVIDDDQDCDIIDVTPAKKPRTEYSSIPKAVHSVFKRIGEWFKRTSRHNTGFFRVNPESNSAEAAIAHGGQYLAEASNDKFMPRHNNRGNGGHSVPQQQQQQGAAMSTGNTLSSLYNKPGFTNGFYNDVAGSSRGASNNFNPIQPSETNNFREAGHPQKDGKFNQDSLLEYESNFELSDEPGEHINGVLQQSYVDQAAKRQRSTNGRTSSGPSLNSSVYDKCYKESSSDYSSSSYNNTSKRLGFDLEEKERYRRLLQRFVLRGESAAMSPNTVIENQRRSLGKLATHPGSLSHALNPDIAIRKRFNLRPRQPLQEQENGSNCLSPEIDTYPRSQPEISVENDVSSQKVIADKPPAVSTPYKTTKIYIQASANPQPSEIVKRCDSLVKKMEELQVRSRTRLAEQKQLRAEEMKLAQWEKMRAAEDDHLEQMVQQRLKLSAKVILEDLPPPEVEEYDEFPELSAEAEMAVAKAWQSGPDNILSDAFKIRIKRSDLATLRGLSWLNDEIINFYYNLIQQRSEQGDLPSVYVFNTFFYPKVMREGHKGVRRWTRQVDLFSKDLLLVPVHLGMHWCLACINLRDGVIQYFDSMGGSNTQCLAALRKYMEDESEDKKKQPLDTSSWVLECVQDIPQQMNGSDCGVFSCKFAEYLSRDAGFTFGQEHMPYFRKRMVYEILTKKLL